MWSPRWTHAIRWPGRRRDRVGLVVGEAPAPASSVRLAVDCGPETVDEAVDRGVDMMVVNHPLLLRGVHSVATTSYQGAVVHRLIRAGVALSVAHRNADMATSGVSDDRPVLFDAAHWATERPWLDTLANELRDDVAAEIIISDLVTDVWTVHATPTAKKEPRP